MFRRSDTLFAIALAAFLVCAAGCAPLSVTDFAAEHQMTVRHVEGNGFSHVVIQRLGSPTGSRLDVYIEGDGIPWRGNFPSADPTPRNTLALRLASLDPNDIAYVGRPCYFGFANADACHPRYWTSHRYGEEVLRSMASVIQQIRHPRHKEVLLIGHSGGGALAALLEPEVAGVVGVITIGANLDIERWAQHHHYDPLTGSLNPLEQTRDPDIPHLQLVGGSDKTVPAYSGDNYSRIQPNVELVVFDDFDHVCCWEEQWPVILSEFSARLID